VQARSTHAARVPVVLARGRAVDIRCSQGAQWRSEQPSDASQMWSGLTSMSIKQPVLRTHSSDLVDINTLTCSGRVRNLPARPCTTRVRDSTPLSRVLHTHASALSPQVAFHVGNAQQLDPECFPDNTHDLYTISFGIRNCTSASDVIKEVYRVLKSGEVFAVLEFSKVTQPILAQ